MEIAVYYMHDNILVLIYINIGINKIIMPKKEGNIDLDNKIKK